MSLSDRLSNARPSGDDETTPTTDDAPKDFDAFDLYYDGEVDGKQSLAQRMKNKLGKKSDASPEQQHVDTVEDEAPVAFDPAAAFKPLDEVVSADPEPLEDLVEDEDVVAELVEVEEPEVDEPEAVSDTKAPETDPLPEVALVDPSEPGPSEPEPMLEVEADVAVEATVEQDVSTGSVPQSTGASEAAAAAVSATTLLSDQVRDEQFWSPYADSFDDLKITASSQVVLDMGPEEVDVDTGGWGLNAEPDEAANSDVAEETDEAAATNAAIASPTPTDLEPFAVPAPEEAASIEPFPMNDVPAPLVAEDLEPAEPDTADAAVAVPQPAQVADDFPIATTATEAEPFNELLSLGQDDSPADQPVPSIAPEAAGAVTSFDALPQQVSAVETMSLTDLPYASDDDDEEVNQTSAAINFADLPYDNEPSFTHDAHPARRADDATVAAVPLRATPNMPPPPMLDELPANGLLDHGKGQREGMVDPVACPSCGAPTHSDLVDQEAGVRHLSCNQCFKIWSQPIG